MALTAKWVGSSSLQEQPGSPRWTYGQRITCTRTFRGPYATAKAAAPLCGSAGTGDQAGLIVRESTVEKDRGGQGVLTINYEWGIDSGEPSQGATLPEDECSIELERLDLPIERHPIFVDTVSFEELEAIKMLLGNKDEYEGDYELTVTSNESAYLLYKKRLKGIESYMIWTPVYSWKSHSWLPQALDFGGYRETPWGPLAAPAGVDWLRCGDKQRYSGGTWVMERSWIGSQSWDTDLYAS